MIAEGDVAPEFSLPAVVDGNFEEVALADYLGDDIIILAFYPADFNPSCAGETTDLDELDLFTMQKDVSILGISADSVYSHRAFADEYDLHIPLLADAHAEVAADYGVAVENPDAGYLTNRAVVVIDPGGEVQYAWQTADLKRLPPVEDVRVAVDDIGGASTAEARYRVGHAHYVEGRRAFTKAMSGFEEMEWMMAQGDFARAQEEFEEAADQFNTAVRFAEDETALTYFERAEEKARALWQAAEWLAESSSAYASGEGAEGDAMRNDAEAPLETARDIHEPPDPDDFPPEDDPTVESESILPTDDDGAPATLETDINQAAETPEAAELADEMETASGIPADAESADTTSTDGVNAGSDEPTGKAQAGGDDGSEAAESEIDDEELEEIAAELEEQTQQAKEKRQRESGDSDEDQPSLVDEPPTETDERVPPEDADTEMESLATPDEERKGDDPDAEDVEEEIDEADIELDLADPTEGTEMEPDEPADIDESEDDEDEDEDDLDGGNHGVPDSL